MSDISQDDLDLQFYEGVRKKVVVDLTKKGIPSDPEYLNILLKAVDGGSKNIIAKKRLEVDKEDTQNKGQALGIVAEMLRNMPTAQQRRERTEPLPTIDVVPALPGETSVGTKEIKYNDIMSSEHQNP